MKFPCMWGFNLCSWTWLKWLWYFCLWLGWYISPCQIPFLEMKFLLQLHFLLHSSVKIIAASVTKSVAKEIKLSLFSFLELRKHYLFLTLSWILLSYPPLWANWSSLYHGIFYESYKPLNENMAFLLYKSVWASTISRFMDNIFWFYVWKICSIPIYLPMWLVSFFLEFLS